ncbi:hypothetical protein SMICM17S_13063 [Streptomyces microflavus]
MVAWAAQLLPADLPGRGHGGALSRHPAPAPRGDGEVLRPQGRGPGGQARLKGAQGVVEMAYEQVAGGPRPQVALGLGGLVPVARGPGAPRVGAVSGDVDPGQRHPVAPVAQRGPRDLVGQPLHPALGAVGGSGGLRRERYEGQRGQRGERPGGRGGGHGVHRLPAAHARTDGYGRGQAEAEVEVGEVTRITQITQGVDACQGVQSIQVEAVQGGGEGVGQIETAQVQIHVHVHAHVRERALSGILAEVQVGHVQIRHVAPRPGLERGPSRRGFPGRGPAHGHRPARCQAQSGTQGVGQLRGGSPYALGTGLRRQQMTGDPAHRVAEGPTGVPGIGEYRVRFGRQHQGYGGRPGAGGLRGVPALGGCVPDVGVRPGPQPTGHARRHRVEGLRSVVGPDQAYPGQVQRGECAGGQPAVTTQHHLGAQPRGVRGARLAQLVRSDGLLRARGRGAGGRSSAVSCSAM